MLAAGPAHFLTVLRSRRLCERARELNKPGSWELRAQRYSPPMLDTSRGRSVTFVMFAVMMLPETMRRHESAKQDDQRPQTTRRRACRRNLELDRQRELARATGRGPTKARTTLGENAVFVVLQDTLTRGEQTLAEFERQLIRERTQAGVEGGARSRSARWPPHDHSARASKASESRSASRTRRLRAIAPARANATSKSQIVRLCGEMNSERQRASGARRTGSRHRRRAGPAA